MNPMFDKLKKIEDRYEFLTAEISRPDIIADNSVWKKLVKEHSVVYDVKGCLNPAWVDDRL